MSEEANYGIGVGLADNMMRKTAETIGKGLADNLKDRQLLEIGKGFFYALQETPGDLKRFALWVGEGIAKNIR